MEWYGIFSYIVINTFFKKVLAIHFFLNYYLSFCQNDLYLIGIFFEGNKIRTSILLIFEFQY